MCVRPKTALAGHSVAESSTLAAARFSSTGSMPARLHLHLNLMSQPKKTESQTTTKTNTTRTTNTKTKTKTRQDKTKTKTTTKTRTRARRACAQRLKQEQTDAAAFISHRYGSVAYS